MNKKSSRKTGKSTTRKSSAPKKNSKKKTAKKTTRKKAPAKKKTARNPAKQSLQTLKERYQDISDLVSDYIFELSLDKNGVFNLDYISGSFSRIFGYTEEKLREDNNWSEYLVHPEDRGLFDGLFRAALAGNDSEAELRFFTKDGRSRWTELQQRPIFDDKTGEVTGLIGAGRDITDRKVIEKELARHRDQLEEEVEARTAENRQIIEDLKAEVNQRGKAEKELREINEVLEGFFQTSHLLIAYLDRDFNFIRVNLAYADVEGEPREYFIGKNHFDLYPHQENQAIFQQVVDTGEPFKTFARPFEYPRRPEWGVTYWDWTLLPIKNREGEVERLVLYLLDVTERERLKQETEHQRAMSIQADRLRSLGEMAAGISHELNQPLSGIRNMAERLLMRTWRQQEISSEDMKEKLSGIIGQVDRMHNIIEHTRMFARGRTRQSAQENVSVNRIIDEATGFVSHQLGNKGIHLEVKKDESVPRLSLNPFSLEEVLFNLINNARDAILEQQKEEGGAPSPFITVRSYAENDHNGRCVKIEVKDLGGGMSEEAYSHAFEPFFSTKDLEHGTGLGLPICKSIIEGMNGSINLSTEPGEGTTVTITVPEKTVQKTAEE